MCLMPLWCINSANSLEINCGPLPDTAFSGNPCWANRRRNSFMVFSVLFRMTINHPKNSHCPSDRDLHGFTEEVVWPISMVSKGH